MPPSYTQPYTQSSATSQGFRYSQPNPHPPLRGSASGWAAQGSRPQQQMQFPPNPFGMGSSSYSAYGAPSGGFGGFSQMGGYSGQMTPFPGGSSFSGFGGFGSNPFGMPSGGYMPSLGSGSPYSSLGGAAGWGAQFDPTSRFLGATVPQTGAGGAGAYDFAPPLPPGGVYGDSKWMPGNGSDIFVPRGTPIFAMFDGVVEPNPQAPMSPIGPVGSFLLRGANGITMQATHAQMTARGPVRKGQQIGIVNDPSMDILGQYPGMPDGFQHLDLTLGHGGPFPISGGDLNAVQALQLSGYQGKRVPGATRGPGGPGGGMGMGMGAPGMGMGGFPGLGGPMMGMPGPMGMGMPGMGPGGPMGFSGPGMGMNPFMGMGQMGMNPFMSMFSGRPF